MKGRSGEKGSEISVQAARDDDDDDDDDDEYATKEKAKNALVALHYHSFEGIFF